MLQKQEKPPKLKCATFSGFSQLYQYYTDQEQGRTYLKNG
jgi:hypothetical protein